MEGLIERSRITDGDKKLSLRQHQELERVLGSPEERKIPIKNTVKRGIGEYAPTPEDRYKSFKHLSKIMVSESEYDRKYVQRIFRHIDRNEQLGLELGIFFGTLTFFLPGVRRLPFYFRIPVALSSLAFCVSWGETFGRDITNMRINAPLETYERELGIRNFQKSL